MSRSDRSIPRGLLIIERPSDWLIVAGDQTRQLAVDASPPEIAAAAQQLRTLAGIKSLDCLIAPGSTSCFFATFEPDEDIDLRDRSALTYELENQLPIDAESMVADFVVSSAASPTLVVSAVAIEIDHWQSVIDAVEDAGFLVRSIIPRAMLVARAVLSTSAVTSGDKSDSRIELLLVDGDHCDSVTMQQRSLSAWKYFNVDPSSIRRHQLIEWQADQQLIVGTDSQQRSALVEANPDAVVIDQDVDELTVLGANLPTSGRSTGGLELRRGALAPSDPLRAIQTPLRFAGLTLAVCLLAIAVAGWWRTQRINRTIVAIRAAQQQRFAEVFPEASVPGAVLRRVRSEHAKLLGSRGKSAPIDIPIAATEMVYQLVAALPEDVRLQFQQIRVTDGHLHLDIRVRNPVDAAALAGSLSAAGFDVKPPGTTQQNSRTFQSTLEAEWTGANASAPARNGTLSVAISINPEVAG